MTEAPPQQPKTVFNIDYIIDAAARRQKWIDQSQSVNLFLAAANAKHEFTAEEKRVCSIDAMMNSGECEACQ